MSRIPLVTAAAAVSLTLSASIAMPQQSARSESSAAATELHTAVLTAQHGDPTKALTLARNLVAKYPKYGPAYKFEGALVEHMGQDAEAEALYEQALGLTPKDPELLFKVGLHRLVAGDYAQAIVLLQRASREKPRDSETLYYLAQAYHLGGDNDSALEAIAKAVQLDPRNAAVQQKYGELLSSGGNNAKAVEWLLKAQRADPSLDRLDFDLGVASLHNEDLEAASQYASKAVAAHPDDLKSLALLAEIDVKLANWQEAKSIFQRLLARNPDDTTALLGLGHSELGLKEFQDSVETLQQLLRREPTAIVAHFYLSRAYASLGNQTEAAHETELHNKLVEQAASVIPAEEREVEKATLVEARQMLTEGREGDAVDLFRKRSKGPTATPGAPYMLVGVSYLYMGRPQDADRWLHKAIAIEPNVRLAHTYLGMLALQRHDLAEAKRQLDLELAQDANSQLAELGEVAYLQGAWQDAADQLDRSRTVDPRLLYQLSDAYFHLNKIKDANLTAELAAAYAKDDPATTERIVALLNTNGQTDLAKRLATR